ncbi:MAG: ABC transporter substrate-binding protein [Halosimplex sp.]
MEDGLDGRREGADGVGLTRRECLAAVGSVGLLGSVAGCTGETDIVDSSQVFGYQFPYNVETTHVGPWSTSDPSAFYSMLYESQSYTTLARPRELGDIVESVETDGKRATVTYADGYTWWSGDDVTARDVWVQDRIQSHVSDRTWPKCELLDDLTVRYEFERPLDRPLVYSTVLDGAVRTKASFYEPWLERFREATTDDQVGRVLGDLRGESPSLETIADEGLGCGPYELTEASINRLMLEKYEDHPRADEITIPRLWFPAVQGTSIENLVGKGWLDGGSGLLREERGTPPDNLEQIARYRTTSGTKLVLDWRNDHLARRGVRRALVAAIPIDNVVDVASWGEPTALQTGLAAPAERRWLSESLRSNLHEYPIGADVERAAAHMRAAGYERDGEGYWRGPGGERATLTLGTPVWSGYVSAESVVTSSLERFGFDVSTDRVPNTQITYRVSNHTYDVMLWSFDGRPYSVYDVTGDGATSIGYGVTDPDAERSSQGKPVTVSVPTTPGDIGAPESERRTVNLVELWRRIRRPTDRATTVDAVETFATWWNDALPDVYLGTAVDGLWGNTRDFSWPAYDDDSRYGTAGPAGRPVFHLLKQGVIAPADGE